MRAATLRLVLLLLPIAAFAADLTKARQLYQYTDYDGALANLRALPSKDADAYALMGEVLLHKGQYKAAADSLEKAVSLSPNSSHFTHILGQAYGREAENANPLMAPRYAVKTHQAFEKAVQLDPSNTEAMNDLLEYYLEAPAFLGGGFSRAEELIPRIAKADPAEGHYAQAQLALKRKDFATAERELRAALAAAPKQPGRLLDLAKFLASQGHTQESDHLYAEALKSNASKAFYARAESYIKQNRNLPEAAILLEKYLSLPITPDDPPRDRARHLLDQARPRNVQSH